MSVNSLANAYTAVIAILQPVFIVAVVVYLLRLASRLVWRGGEDGGQGITWQIVGTGSRLVARHCGTHARRRLCDRR